ncbi:ABC transporter permease [Anaeropeptidivorans aminofermentans]|uniref:ABC transporter permease n=1 Tax=Anaeropeptidivorans aminofermentans TaxID=2934315 RepID=UPI002024F3BE|nr:ABC transporter permease [Anaeropeptidivorans aminofermentans]
MSSIDIIVMSLRNLFKRKVRTFLTILGVVIGTAAIIVMISLGIAVNKNFEDSLSSMGDIRILTVYNPSGGNGRYYAMDTNASSSRGKDKVTLDEKALETFKKLPNVVAATPTMEIYLQSVSGKYVTSLNIKGVDPEAMEAFEYKIDKGELLRSDEKYAAVFGATAASNYRDPKDRNWWMKDNTEPVVNVMEDKIEVSYDWSFGQEQSNPFYTEEETGKQKPKPIKLSVKGVLQPMNWDTDYYVFMNIKDVQKLKADQARYEQSQNSGGGYSGGQRSTNTNEFDNILIKVNDVKNVEAVKAQIEEMGFYADSYFIDMLNQMNEMSRSLQLFLGAIGAVSLFVAAIGITNTMIMSIYERTREIGIMKVIGASIKDIKKLFLLEAALIGFIGGLAGLGLSYLISFLLNNTGMSFLSGITGGGMGGGSSVSVIPLWLSLAALAFACVIGLVSGYFPAKRAMNLSALAAIRTE